jgi:hypothetical protein
VSAKYLAGERSPLGRAPKVGAKLGVECDDGGSDLVFQFWAELENC